MFSNLEFILNTMIKCYIFFHFRIKKMFCLNCKWLTVINSTQFLGAVIVTRSDRVTFCFEIK